VYQERQIVREAGHDITRTFIAEGRVALKRNWLLLIYMVLLMAGFNFMVILSDSCVVGVLTEQRRGMDLGTFILLC